MRSNLFRNRITRLLLYSCLSIAAFITIFPFVWMFFSTLKTEAEILRVPIQVFPTQLNLDNYKYIWESLSNFPRYIFNSAFVTVSVVVLNCFFDSLAAFAFCKLKFKGRKLLFALLLVALLVPAQIMYIELYRIIRTFHWTDSYLSLIIPNATSAFGIFLIWQFMKTIPDDFLEAARMEGATDFMAFWKVYLPLSVPAIATLAIFQFINTWNDFLWPLIVSNREEMRTLTVGLALMQGNNVTHWSWLMTGAFISVAPVLLFYLFAQRYFISGLTAGGVKG